MLNNIQNYIESLFNQSEADFLMYHNLEHTKFVVAKTQEIGADHTLDKTDFLILSASAWFHDAGHLTGGLKFHED
ncbi:hypothetical protein [Segetibacter aerophilus]|nr:hypothetical protein [Segetibacter aerophilus]